MPELNRALLLGGVLALGSAFFFLRWGHQLLRAVWRRLNTRRGMPYLRHSISSFGGLTLLAAAGLLAGGLVCFAELAMRRAARFDGDVVEVGRLDVRASPGRVGLSLTPAGETPFAPGTLELAGERWRVHGDLVQFTGLWRTLGLTDGYRMAAVEAAAGPLGRPDDWRIERGALVPEDAWFGRLVALADRLPGVRMLPHVTDWEAVSTGAVTLVVTPSGHAFLPAEESGSNPGER